MSEYSAFKSSLFTFPSLCVFTVLCWYGVQIALGDATGWDTSSHLALTHFLHENLHAGSVFAYRTDWYAGFPSFVLYPPGFYLYTLLPHYLSFKLIGVDQSFQYAIAVLPIFLFLAFLWSTHRLFGSKCAYYSPFLFGFFLFYPNVHNHLGLGLSGTFAIGFLPQTLSLILLLYMLPMLVQRHTPLRTLILTIMFSLLISTHILTSCFAFFLILVTALFRFTKPRVVISCGFTLICAPLLNYVWLKSFFANLRYSSSEPIGLGLLSDPLLSLFPGLSFSHFDYLRAAADYRLIIGDTMLTFSPFIAEFPLYSFTLILMLPLLIKRISQAKNKLLFILFLTSLLLLPRNIGLELLPFGIHYYRFITPIFLLGMIVFSAALLPPQRQFNMSYLFWRITVSMLSISFFFTALIQYRLYTDERNWQIEKHVYQQKFSDYPLYSSAQEAITEIISRKHEFSRLSVQSSTQLARLLGSPHYFTAVLPRMSGIEVVPGLLAESTPTADFINSTLVAMDISLRVEEGHLSWGQRSVLRNLSFLSHTPEFYARKLVELGVSHYLATTSQTIRALNEQGTGSGFKEIWSNNAFALYEILPKQPRTEILDQLPFAFKSVNSRAFHDFATGYFASRSSHEAYVVEWVKPLNALPRDFDHYFAGLIYQCDAAGNVSAHDKSFLVSLGDRTILLGCKKTAIDELNPYVVIPTIDEQTFIVDIPLVLTSRLQEQKRTSNSIEGQRAKVIVSKSSFSPLVQDEVEVYRVTPNFQLRFAR